jgi:hypothetical protein
MIDATRRTRTAWKLSLAVAAALLLRVPAAWGQAPPPSHQPPPDSEWTADAEVAEPRVLTLEDLGAAQGVSLRDGKLYAYGDVYSANPRVGVIREYTMDLKPTGRVVWLRRDGKPLILHPTGLTWDPAFGTFLGDTVAKRAKIYRLDWARAWADGTLDHAVLDVIDDDVAVNGCRPVFTTVGGRTLLATADYGDVRPEIRLYDPAVLLAAGRSSAPGVVVHRVLAGAWNQNLHWDGATGRLTCIQNVVEGRGWRLETIDLARAVADGRAWSPSGRVAVATLPPHDELEGFLPLDSRRILLITSSRRDNAVVGVLHPVPPSPSPPGTAKLTR